MRFRGQYRICKTRESVGHTAPDEFRAENLPSAGENGRPCQKMSRARSSAYLPLEIMAMVIARAMIARPRCALSLVVPDWNICRRETTELEQRLRYTRIVSYTRGTESAAGALSYKYDHDDSDHVLTPMIRFDPRAVALNVMFSSEYTRQLYRSHTHVFTLGVSHLSREAIGRALGSDRADHQPLRGPRLKAILPFDDEPVDTVKLRAGTGSAPIHQGLRHIAVHSPLQLMQLSAKPFSVGGDADDQSKADAINKALDLDRSAHLWLSWSQMPNLESVLLDLRIYSHDLNTERRVLSKFQVMDRAREMGRHLRLKMLVLAGLQSYSFHTLYEGVTVQNIEEWDDIDGEPNWIKVFRPAVRGGGKIVLVDRLTDYVLDQLP
ncbi:hypothetical protein F4802DRAFT_35762 [Xylaria palmicola]|nr:hypothetical protein F4802DRAFT_35762 [Xylaria palmicola]